MERPGASCAPVPDERRVQAVFAGRVAWRSVRAVTGHVHALHWRHRSSRRGWTDPARAPSDTSRLDAVALMGATHDGASRIARGVDQAVKPVRADLDRAIAGRLPAS